MTLTQPHHDARDGVSPGRPARRPSRVLGAVVAAMVMILCAIGVGATPAQAASSSTLCKGFTQCANEGRGSAGYASVYRHSFWNMRKGHNCTNYIAYRLTASRLTSRLPGAVDAGTWRKAARAAGVPVNGAPRVGAVAWWGAGQNGAGSHGHVAYVEAVRPDGSIVISEDVLGGNFGWRTLSTSSRGWPSGFIHFPTSNGSPAGRMLWATSGGAGKIQFSGSAAESDVKAGPRKYLVTVGGPRNAAGVESFTFVSSYFRFVWLQPLKTRGRTAVYVYALNTPGSAGSDTLLGRRSVTIR